MSSSDPPAKGAEKINFELFLELEKLKDKVKQLETENTRLQKQEFNDADNSRVKQLEEDNELLQMKLDKARKELDEKQGQWENEIEKMKAQYSNSVQDKPKDYEEYETKINRQNKIIDELEEELVELDKKYDTYIISLKKKMKGLEAEIQRLEKENQHLTSSGFSHLRSKSVPHKETTVVSNTELVSKMREILKSWPGGIKLRNLAMSMGISVSATNEYLSVLEAENQVRIDTDNMKDSNPVIYPI